MPKPKRIEDAAKEMRKRTALQAKSLGKSLPPHVGDNYMIQDELFEGRRNNRWLLGFPKEANIQQNFIKSITRPSYPFHNEIFIELNDPETISLTDNLLKMIGKCFKLKLSLLDAIGNNVEKWVFKGCEIISIDWSPLNYKDDNISSIILKVKYKDIKFKNSQYVR